MSRLQPAAVYGTPPWRGAGPLLIARCADTASAKFDSGCGWPVRLAASSGLPRSHCLTSRNSGAGVRQVRQRSSSKLAASPRATLTRPRPHARAGSVKTHADTSLGMRRVEILCANCDGHLGHGNEAAARSLAHARSDPLVVRGVRGAVFEGERMTKTNERHCVNSVRSVDRAASWGASRLA